MEAANAANGIKCDVEFQMMVEKAKARVKPMSDHAVKTSQKINICVRKRPAF